MNVTPPPHPHPAVDFDYTSPAGFAGSAASLPPTLQIAFQYTALVVERGSAHPPVSVCGGGGAAGRFRPSPGVQPLMEAGVRG